MRWWYNNYRAYRASRTAQHARRFLDKINTTKQNGGITRNQALYLIREVTDDPSKANIEQLRKELEDMQS